MGVFRLLSLRGGPAGRSKRLTDGFRPGCATRRHELVVRPGAGFPKVFTHASMAMAWKSLIYRPCLACVMAMGRAIVVRLGPGFPKVFTHASMAMVWTSWISR